MDRNPSQIVKRFPRNQLGRDFVIGDIHGSFDQVLDALRRVRFDRARDRLFSLGDTVDRGPGSHRALKFLEQTWVHAIRGNHEDMFLEAYQDGEPHPGVLEFITCRNGMAWWNDYPTDQRDLMIAAFRRLPLAIEIETARGTVGLVHAQVPKGMAWGDFTAALERGDKDVTHEALWGEDRLYRKDASGVAGIGRVFTGHRVVESTTRLGNVYYIDTGAVFGVLNNDPTMGRLTLANIAEATRTFERDPETGELFEVRAEAEVVDAPFGDYAAPTP